MSLVFAGITPHPPLLLPSIGKEAVDRVKKTLDGFERLEKDLYVAKPHTIIIISPHTGRFERAFCINADTNFVSHYEEFGDLSTRESWSGAEDMAARIQHAAGRAHVDGVRLISEKELDHGAAIPLHFLTRHLPDVRVLPIGYSNADSIAHLRFGELLKEAIMETDRRVAVIASGDLSHCHSTDGPGGFHKDGSLFDKKLIELLETRNTIGLVQMDEQLIKNAEECAHRSLLILLGILKDMDYTFKNYSYEAPFGVGYLVGHFTL